MSVNEKYPDISTKRSQRIVIWIICIVMAVGFLIGLFVWVVAIINPDTDPNQITYNKALEEYQKQIEDQMRAEEEAAAKRQVFGGYEVRLFDPESISQLGVEVLREGDGEIVTPADTISAYYTGWQSDGRIFDSTQSVDSPNTARSFPLGQVITGWTEGLSGQKVGGVYRLSIPAEMAYGAGMGIDDYGRPLGPLMFIVEIVSKE